MAVIKQTNKQKSFPLDSQSPTPPGGEGGVGERAEGGHGGQLVVQELWFIVVMTGIALLLLAIVIGVMLHKVRGTYFVSLSMSRATAKGRMAQHGSFSVKLRQQSMCCSTVWNHFGSLQQILCRNSFKLSLFLP